MQPDRPPQAGDPSTPSTDGGLDLLTIGLVVFFVALIVIVAALMLVPAIF